MFEVLLSVHEESDPAAPIARRVMLEYPHVPARLMVVGPSPYPNAKVWSLRALLAASSHEAIVMTDSDVRVPPGGMETMIAEMAQPRVSLVTCPYRAVSGPRLWPRMEALGLNTEFIGGVLTARLLNGMDFAIGCTIATRRAELEAIGGLENLQRYLAEDFMMGRLVRERGGTIVLSRCIIEHHIGSGGFLNTWKHRVRWARSTRRSRPTGYVGVLFTETTAIAMLLWIASPQGWEIAVPALLVRAAVVWATGIWVLRDPLVKRYWWLVPLEDIAGLATWILGFFGKTILWRGRRLAVSQDGSLN